MQQQMVPTQVQRKMEKREKNNLNRKLKHQNELILWCCWTIEVSHSTDGNDRFGIRLAHSILCPWFTERVKIAYKNIIHEMKCVFFGCFGYCSVPFGAIIFMLCVFSVALRRFRTENRRESTVVRFVVFPFHRLRMWERAPCVGSLSLFFLCPTIPI